MGFELALALVEVRRGRFTAKPSEPALQSVWPVSESEPDETSSRALRDTVLLRVPLINPVRAVQISTGLCAIPRQ